MDKENKTDSYLYDNDQSWIGDGISDLEIDDKFLKIYTFFVLRSPVKGCSSQRRSFEFYGWGPNPFSTPDLRIRLEDCLITSNDYKSNCNKKELGKEARKIDLDEGFGINLTPNRYVSTSYDNAVIIDLARHIRNALAHGRFAIRLTQDNKRIYLLEDGSKYKGNFSVSARICLTEESLLDFIDVVESPDKINPCLVKVLKCISKGYNQKKDVVERLQIDDNQWNWAIEHLNRERLISNKTKGNRMWYLTDEGIEYLKSCSQTLRED